MYIYILPAQRKATDPQQIDDNISNNEGIEARIVKKCKELNKPMESSSNLEE